MNTDELKRIISELPMEFMDMPLQVIMSRPRNCGTRYHIRTHVEPSIMVEPDDYWEDGHIYEIDDYGYIQPDEKMDCDPWRHEYARYMALTAPKYILDLMQSMENWKNHAIASTLRYEELRKIIDGGSESMTHADAVQVLREVME